MTPKDFAAFERRTWEGLTQRLGDILRPTITVLSEANFVRCDPNYGLKVREAREAFRKLHGAAEGDVCEGEAAFADEAVRLDAEAWKTRHSGLVGLAAREAMPFESKGRK